MDGEDNLYIPRRKLPLAISAGSNEDENYCPKKESNMEEIETQEIGGRSAMPNWGQKEGQEVDSSRGY